MVFVKMEQLYQSSVMETGRFNDIESILSIVNLRWMGCFFMKQTKGVESMTRQRKWFYGIFGALFALILLFYGLILMFTYRGTPEAMEKWNKHSYVKKNQYYRFEAKGEEQANLLFYTGALVEPQAYVGIAEELAQNGITTYVIESSLNLPIFEMGTMETIVKEEKLDKVYVAGIP